MVLCNQFRMWMKLLFLFVQMSQAGKRSCEPTDKVSRSWESGVPTFRTPRSFVAATSVHSPFVKLHKVVPHHDDGRLGDSYIAAREPPDAMYEKRRTCKQQYVCTLHVPKVHMCMMTEAMRPRPTNLILLSRRKRPFTMQG